MDELRAIQRREIEHLVVEKEFEDATTAVDDEAPLPPAADDKVMELEEIDDGVDRP